MYYLDEILLILCVSILTILLMVRFAKFINKPKCIAGYGVKYINKGNLLYGSLFGEYKCIECSSPYYATHNNYCRKCGPSGISYDGKTCELNCKNGFYDSVSKKCICDTGYVNNIENLCVLE